LITTALLGSYFVLAAEDKGKLKLRLRTVSRRPPGSAAGRYNIKDETWEAKKTALFICDVWDDHWCKSAAGRVGERVGPLNEVVKELRKRGVLIVHAPSSVVDFYKDTPQRKRAKEAPFAKTPIKLSTSPRWGTAWCWTDGKREGVLPIDDSDMGCDCEGKKC